MKAQRRESLSITRANRYFQSKGFLPCKYLYWAKGCLVIAWDDDFKGQYAVAPHMRSAPIEDILEQINREMDDFPVKSRIREIEIPITKK